jgi:threonine/homoserine/homoserine lactone efflux protein
LTVSTALRRGAPRGAAAMGGIVAGNLLYFGLSALGVVALLLASYQVFTFVKWAGAAYLAYLGVRALCAKDAAPGAFEAAAARPGAGGTAFASGFVTQVANPKAIVFFVAVLPQFVDPHGNLGAQMLVLAAISQGAECAVLSAYIAAAAHLRRSRVAERASVWIERAGGAVLLAIAARIAREPLAAR